MPICRRASASEPSPMSSCGPLPAFGFERFHLFGWYGSTHVALAAALLDH